MVKFRKNVLAIACTFFLFWAQHALASNTKPKAYVETLVATATSLQLSQQIAWRKLLFYTPIWFGGERGIFDSRTLYLSPDGKVDAEAELIATLKAFFRPLGDYADANLHPQCAFPARFIWLNERLHFDRKKLPPVPCAKLQAWRRANRYRALSLVFSSYYPDNPASMFGHTFFRLHRNRDVADQGSGQLDSSINFAAHPDTLNPFLYPWKGTLGFFPGRYQMLPYFMKVQEYNNAERRDLWQYELNFTADEIDRLLLSLWEIGSNYADYYYFDDNCSAILLTLLEAVRPRLNLKSQFPGWVIPADTLRAVTRQPGLVRSVRFEPSILSRFVWRHRQLDDQQRQLMARLVDLKKEPPLPTVDRLAHDDAAKIYDAAADLIDFEDRIAGSVIGKTYKTRRALLLRSRARHPVRSRQPDLYPADEQPDRGHDSSRLSLSGGVDSRREPIWDLTWRPALHELIAANTGYPDGLEIGFFHTSIRYDQPTQQAYLNEYSLIRILSVPTLPAIIRRPAWLLDVGAKTEWHGRNSSARYLNKFIKAGVGMSFSIAHQSVVGFGLVQAAIGSSREPGFRRHLSAGSVYGVWLNMARTSKGLLRGETIKRFGTRVTILSKLTAEWSWAIHPQVDVRLWLHGEGSSANSSYRAGGLGTGYYF